MKVYRLESNGYGVFCSESRVKQGFASDALYKTYGCTVPRAHWNDDYRFACESIGQLIEYFGSDFAEQLDQGADIVEYTVHKAHVLFSMEGIELAFREEKGTRRVIYAGANSERVREAEQTPDYSKVYKMGLSGSFPNRLVDVRV